MIKKIIKEITPKSFLDSIFRIKKYIKYYRNGVKCPVCDQNFKRFKDFGLRRRSNAYCPNCGSLERHRLLWMYLNQTEKINNRYSLKILHFAPENFFYNYFINKENIEYKPVDLTPEAYHKYGLKGVTKADITDIPFKDDYFDIILCNHVLEHIPDDRKAMSELFRVLKIGGYGIFQVPIDYSRTKTYEDFSITEPDKRERAFGQKDHVRWYGKDYPDRLRRVGFKVKEDNFIESFNEKEKFRFGLLENEIIYKCYK